MKRTIRLTESDLHKFIKESVENILTELDPRTYANYAKQRTDKGQYDKAARGTQAAVNAWNKKYGTKDYEKQNNGAWRQRKMNPNISDGSYRVNNQEYLDNGFQNKDNYSYQDTHTFHPQGNIEHHRDYIHNDDTKKDIYDFKSYDNNQFTTDDEGLKVAQQMANGTGQYTKGKGWK